jgi:predicted porin
MKKSLLAFAVMGAFAGVASAQTSVTIYGSFDAGLRNVTNVNAAGQSRLTMGSNGTYNSNRLGFRGVEDLGGGMNAHFVLENGFNSGTGAAAGDLFARQALVGLGGAWGSLDLGRQYTVGFKVIAAYDPFAYKYTAIAPAVAATAGVRYNNDIQYTGNFGPLTARAEYAVGEVAGNASTGSAKSIGLSYNVGALSLGGAYTDRDVATFDNKYYTLGGAYKLANSLKFSVGYADEKQATIATEVETKYSWVGVAYDFTPALQGTYAYYQTKVTGTAAQNAKKDLHMVGATYALSKRTNFYAEMDFAKLDGISVGINHTF